ncbi:MAG: glycosyltransferase family 2 protein [Verrucomicrobiae bacterium]|nr:glycosyltransferase family 2 protein [Verrucomicrobiae bacterium]
MSDGDRRVNVVMPMAGRGQRFLDSGVTVPKPLIRVAGRTILEWILRTLSIPGGRYIFIVREEHVAEHRIDQFLRGLVPGCEVVVIDRVTEGAACTVLLAEKFIGADCEMVIKDCDQIINWHAPGFFEFVGRHAADGAVVTVATQNPGFSYARLDAACSRVVETKEKRVISAFGCSGLYYFARGSDFVRYARQMIDKNIRVNNEFYVSPIYNEYIDDGRLILNYPIAEMFSFNTPEELAHYEARAVPFLRQFDGADAAA